MTSAAVPAVSGAASLVPPDCSTAAGLPAKLVHSKYSAGLGVHSAQFRSPGATSVDRRPVLGEAARAQRR